MAAVGEVLLRWGYLETEMLKKISESGYGPTPHSTPIRQWRLVSARSASDLSAWTDEIERAARLRNLLAHGLIGGSAQPVKGDPGVTCRDLDGACRFISCDDFTGAQSLDSLRLRLFREPDDLLRARQPSPQSDDGRRKSRHG